MGADKALAFGTLLRLYRDARALTQEELAERAGLTPQAIGLLERGERRRPQRYTVQKVADALGLSAEERAQFEGAARDAPIQRGLSAPRSDNLPIPPSPLVGREQEVATVARLLRLPNVRLLTLTGPGGVGKTRLAQEVAASLRPAFADGVNYTPLVALCDPALVPSAVAQALGIELTAGRAAPEGLMEALRDREMLLLLDNFEHLLGAAPLVADLHLACPGLTMLVTSRTPLRLRGEHQFPVSPLPVVGAPEASPAVELFGQRARAAVPTFALSDANMTTVADICRRVDGLPLAIELVGARVKLLPPSALLERLARRRDASWALLTGGGRDLPEHQRALRDTIAWSYDLLSPREQTLFRRLAVFAGGCTVDAVERVRATVGEEEGAVVEGLVALVDNSLIQPRPAISGDWQIEREPRFAMLEYAVDLLDASGEAEEVQRRHAEYFVRLAESAQMVGPDQAAWIARLEDELDNMRRTLAWAEEVGDAETGLRLVVAVWRFWLVRGYLGEGNAWLERMLALQERDRVRHDLLRAKVLWTLGLFAKEQRDYQRAKLRYGEALTLYRSLGDGVGVTVRLAHLGIVAQEEGDLNRAEPLLEEALSVGREVGEPHGTAMVLIGLADVTRARGDLARTESLLGESLALFRSMGHAWGIARALTMLGDAACVRRDLARAASLYGEALELHRTVRAKQGITGCLEGLAEVACARGELALAARLGGAASALREEMGWPLPPAARERQERVAVAAREGLGAGGFEEAWAAGRELGLADAIEVALDACPDRLAPSNGDSGGPSRGLRPPLLLRMRGGTRTNSRPLHRPHEFGPIPTLDL